jgi:hypothetical protein
MERIFRTFILFFILFPVSAGILMEKAYGLDTGDVFLNLQIGAVDNHSFESASCDWTFDTYDMAVMRTVTTNTRANSGSRSLQLDCHLTCTSPSNSGEAKWTMASPTNLYNRTISAYVWCPRGSGGRVSAPNGLSLYVKIGSDWRWKDNGWNSIGTLTNQWIHLTWTLNSVWAQTNVMEMGLKYGASGTCNSSNWYTGPVFLDDVTW